MDGELLSLKWNNHRTTFFQVISGFRNKTCYTDATLACAGKFYPVHRFVLSTCSEYFSDMFERIPCKNPYVVLKDIDCKDLEFLLDYMYIGEVNVRQTELSSLIRAAECLRIKGLAVPDEDAAATSTNKSSSTSNNSNSNKSNSNNNSSNSNSNNNSNNSKGRGDNQREPSPPAKRRRQHQQSEDSQSADDRRSSTGSSSSKRDEDKGVLERLSGGRDGSIKSDGIIGGTSIPTAATTTTSSSTTPVTIESSRSHHHLPTTQDSQIKLEPQDLGDVTETDYLHNNSLGEDPGGDLDDDTSSDLQEFLKVGIEKEEPLQLSDYNPADFPGPSGLQNSGVPWGEGENSFQTDRLTASAVGASNQPQTQQQQQQQLCRMESALGISPRDGGSGLDISRFLVHPNIISGIKQSQPWRSGKPSQCPPESCKFRCSFCNYATPKRFNMTKHIRTHTREMPYVCNICFYRTSDPSNLKSHIRAQHTQTIEHSMS